MFSVKFRNGKINVNDMPMVLHTLKISMSDSEMRQALRAVEADVNEMLDFTEFLKVMNDTSPSTAQDPEFQNVLNMFSKVKSGRVATADVASVLESMNIPVTPEMLKDVMQHAHEDNTPKEEHDYHTMDIGDIIFTLDELQRQYEDVSIIDETTSGKRASTISGHQPQQKKKGSLPSRMPEPSTSKKPIVPPQPHPSKTTGGQEEPDLKLSKRFSETRRLSSGIIRESVGLQEEPDLKLPKKSSETRRLSSGIIRESVGLQEEPDLKLPKRSSETRRLSSGIIRESVGLQEEPDLKLPKRSSETRRLSSGIIKESVGLQEEPDLKLSKRSSELRRLSSGIIRESVGLQEEPDLKLSKRSSELRRLSSGIIRESVELQEEPDLKLSKRSSETRRLSSGIIRESVELQEEPDLKLSKRSSESRRLSSGTISSSVGLQEELDLKLSKRSSESRRLSSGTISSSVGLQESHLKSLDSKSKSPSLKSAASLKLLDKSDTSISERQKVAVKKLSSSLQLVSSTKESTVSILENVNEAITKLREDFISPEELQFVLPSVGIALSDEDFQKIVPEITQTESGMVNLDDFITAVSKEHNFPDYDALNNVIEGISKIQDEYVDYEDLDTCLENFGVYLPKSERQRIKELIQVDETKQVNIKDFIDAMLKNTHPFSEDLLLPIAIENLQNLSKDQMDISQLWNTLSSLDSNLKRDEFLEAVKLATPDGDKVQLEDLSKIVKDMHDSFRLKELQEIASALDSLEGEKIHGKKLEEFLKRLGITSFKDEVNEILQSDIVSADNMVSVKDCMEALKDTSKFSNFTALKEAIDMLDSIKESYWSDKERYLEGLEDLEGLKNEMLSLDLKLPTVSEMTEMTVCGSEIKEAADILSQVEDGKIAVSDLERALKYLNLNLTEEDFKEVLKHCDISDDMEVELQDFLMKLKDTPSFKDSVVTQLLLATPQVLEKDLIDVSDLKKLLSNENLRSAKAILTEVLKHVPEDEEGKITIEEFVNKVADILRTLKSEREKEILYNTNFDLNNIDAASEIKKHLNVMGIHPTDSDIQRAMENAASSGDVVKLKDLIRELANSDVFSECQKIEDIHNIIDVVSDGKVDVKDLLSVLKSLKKPLEEEDQSEESRTSEMNEKDVILRETIDHFTGASTAATPFNSLLKGIKTIENIRNNKMPVDELVSNLMSTGMPVNHSTMQEILRQASVNENDEVSLKEVLENLSTRKPDPILEDIENALSAAKLMTSDKIQATNLKDALKDLNIHLNSEDEELLEKTLNVDENGDVSQRAALLALKSNKRLKDFRAVNELAKALDKVTSEKIRIDDLKHISKGLGLGVPDKELQNLDARVSVDEEGNVDLKEWLMKLKGTPHFSKSSKTQAPLKTLASIRKNETNFDDLPSILKNIGVALPQDIIETALKNMAHREDGKLDLEEFLNQLIKTQVSSTPEREKIDTSSMDDILKNMDITLTDEEKQILFEHMPVPDDEEIDMETLIGAVKMLKEKIDIANLSNYLSDMGVELSEEEQSDLLTHLPVNAEGKISQLQLVDTMKTLKSGKVDTAKIDSVLEKMGMALTGKEFQYLQENLPIDTDGKVALNILLDEVKLLKKEEGKAYVTSLDTILEKMGPDFSDRTSEELVKKMEVTVHLSKPLMEVPHISGETVDIRDLDAILEKMDIELTKGEVEDLKRYLSAEGKIDLDSLVNVLQDTTGGEIDVSDMENVIKVVERERSSREQLEREKSFPSHGRDVDRKSISKHKESEPEIQEPSELMDNLSIEGRRIDVTSLDDSLGKMQIHLSEKALEKVTEGLPEGEKIDLIDIRSILHLRNISGESIELKNISIDDIREFYQKKLAESVEDFEGKDIDVQEVESVLQTMNVKLSGSQMSDLKQNLQVDDSGKTSLRSLLDSITAIVAKELGIEDARHVPEDVESEDTDKDKLQLLKSHLSDEWIPDPKDLNILLQRVGIKLEEQEISDLLRSLPVGVHGKVETETLLDKVASFTGKKIHSSEMKDVLEDMGIEITDEGLRKLKEVLPFDASDHVFQNRMLDVVVSMNEGDVKLDNVDSVLENLGVKLTPKEQGSVMRILLSEEESADGRVPLSQLMLAVTEVTGGQVNIKDIKSTLEKMGIELTENECSQIENTLPVNANGKVYKNRLLEMVVASKSGLVDVANIDTVLQNMEMKFSEKEMEHILEKVPVDENQKVELKTLLESIEDFAESGTVFEKRMLEEVKAMKGGMIKVSNLDTILESLDIELTDKEHESLTEHLPLTADGKIHLGQVLETVEAITGGDVEICDMGNALNEMGITLTEQEHKELLEHLPITSKEKVHKNRIMDGLKSFNRGTVNVNKLDTVLKNMGWKLTNDEIKDLKQSLAADVHGRVALKKLFKGLNTFTGPKVDMRVLPNIMEKMGLELTDKERMRLISGLPVDDSGKIYKNRLLSGIKSFKGGKVKQNKINATLENMGINLTEKELDLLKENLPDDGSGKVNFQALMKEVNSIIGEEENIKDMKDILDSLGVEFTDEEFRELMVNLPVDADGNFYHNRLMNTMKSLKSGKASVNKLDTMVKSMGIKLSDMEFKDMTKSLPVSDAGEIEMKKLVDVMKAYTGNKIDVNDLQNVLGNMGIELTEKTLSDLLKILPVDDDEMVFQRRLMNEVKARKEGKVDVSNLDTVLENMDIKLTEAELKDLTETLPVDDKDKAELSNLMESVKTLTGEETDVKDVKNILEEMGINLTEKELLKLLKHLPVDEDGKVYRNRLMDSLTSLKGGTISATKIDSLLGSMGVKLEEEELNDLMQNLQTDADGNVSLKTIMDEVKNFSGNKIDAKDLQNYLRNLGVELTEEECSELKKALPTDAAGKVYQNKVLNSLKSQKGGMINVNDLDKVLKNMGLDLTEKELKSLRDNLIIKADGKISLSKLLDTVKAARGESFDIDDLKDVMEDMGIELTDKELLRLMENITDADRNAYHKRLMEGLKTYKEGKIKTDKVDMFLKNIDVDVTETELKDLKHNLPVSVNGKIDVRSMINEANVFTGEKIDVRNLRNLLRNMGIEFTDPEYAKLLRMLPVDHNGMVYWNRVLKAVKFLKGGKVDVKSLGSFLENMGIKLTEQEVEELAESLPVDANGKVDLEKVMDEANAFTGEKIGMDEVKNVLENMGLEYKDQELSKLMENLPFDEDGKIYRKRLLDNLKSLKGGMVSTSNLKSVMDDLGIKLKDNEFKDLIQSLPVGVNKKISLDTLMKKLNSFTGDKVDASDLRNILKNLGIELTEKEQERLLKTLPIDDAGKIYYNRLLKGVKSFSEGKVHVNNLDNVLKSLGIKLSEEEFARLSEDLPVDGWVISLDINHAYWESRVGVAIEFTNNTHFPPGIPWAPDMEEEDLVL
ncbi:Predicted gene 11639 [Apodemus speciosus]|uniref:Predicted gene 11639 n=1 Tax=Apodemus speciosus TaxID=105296 RepID=A0ABQ0FCG1_APOSI